MWLLCLFVLLIYLAELVSCMFVIWLVWLDFVSRVSLIETKNVLNNIRISGNFRLKELQRVFLDRVLISTTLCSDACIVAKRKTFKSTSSLKAYFV